MTINDVLKKAKHRQEMEKHTQYPIKKEIDYYSMVIDALEKQIPKKVEGHRDCCSYKFYKCPSCKTDLIMRPQYCDKCGQRLEWQNDK